MKMIELDSVLSNADWVKRTPDTTSALATASDAAAGKPSETPNKQAKPDKE